MISPTSVLTPCVGGKSPLSFGQVSKYGSFYLVSPGLFLTLGNICRGEETGWLLLNPASPCRTDGRT